MESSLQISTQDGFSAHLAAEAFNRNHDEPVILRFEDGAEIAIPASILHAALTRNLEGFYHLPMSRAELSALGRETWVIPVAEEKAVWHTHQVDTGRVRIHKRVVAHPETLDTAVWQDSVEVERVAVNRPVEGPVAVRYEGDTLIVPVLEETLVVEKRLILKEELRIARHRIEAHQPRQVVLRREEVSVERLPAPAAETDPG